MGVKREVKYHQTKLSMEILFKNKFLFTPHTFLKIKFIIGVVFYLLKSHTFFFNYCVDIVNVEISDFLFV